jgi:hypothetical protein
MCCCPSKACCCCTLVILVLIAVGIVFGFGVYTRGFHKLSNGIHLQDHYSAASSSSFRAFGGHIAPSPY